MNKTKQELSQLLLQVPRAYIMHWNCLVPQKFKHASSRIWSPKQQKFAMNKALEQKLIGPMEESHTKQQSPKAVL